jgi:anti-sigma regulatory factor (Ser/Thr protein kinase)
MNLPSTVAPPLTARLRASVQQLAATRAAPALARREANRLLELWGLAYLVDTVRLVVSELVTNAVIATEATGRVPNSIVAVRLSWAGRSVIVEVWDRNPHPPILRTPDLDSENGRGLRIVESLSAAAACYPSLTGRGKVSWCQIEAPEPAGVDIPALPIPRRMPTVARADPGEYFDDLAVLRRVLDRLRALGAPSLREVAP